MNAKKYILKPGKHQFAPGSQAIHSNDTLTDAEAAWYLERYPHIQSLFSKTGEQQKTNTGNKQKNLKSKPPIPKINDENLPAPN